METFRAWAVVESATAGGQTLLAVFTSDLSARDFAQQRADQLPMDADDAVQVVEFDGETGEETSREAIEPTHDEATCQCDRCRLARRLNDLMD